MKPSILIINKDEYLMLNLWIQFELISKEARKYGRFLCIATQMPRDIHWEH